MAKTRYEITGELESLTPLHVGNGNFRDLASAARDGECPGVAEIIRDVSGAPYLSGTTLKGLLRRLAEALPNNQDQVDRLFGEIKDDGQGRMGAVLVRGAPRTGVVSDTSAAPYARDAGAGIFVAARTSIDPASGTAKDSTLFFQEMVAARTRFEFRTLIESRDENGADDLALGLIAILNRLTAADGQAVGKGQADGFGRLRLDPDKVRITRHVLGSQGEFVSTDRTALWTGRQPIPGGKEWSSDLTLRCDGPFVIMDASAKPQRGEGEGKDGKPQLASQRLGEKLPLVLGTSISGALRARAGWLAALAGTSELIPSVFGTTGQRGRLAIDRLNVAEAEPWEVTSVKLDRHSGAPVDNALFTTATFLGVSMELRLRFDLRDQQAPSAPELALLATLVEDIRLNGLQLGHGGNKGFGWFVAEEVRNGFV